VTVEFSDVLDLVRQSAVRVNDVTVGEVEDISLAGWTAKVRIRIAEHVKLPDNAIAAIRQTSLLGEKFVSLAEPTTEPTTGALSDGDVIPLSRTRRSAEIEEVLGAIGMFLNGGGLTNAKTIMREIGVALEGNEEEMRSLLRQFDALFGQLNAQKADIARGVDALDRLLTKVAGQRATVATALDVAGPALTVLTEQRSQLTTALTALGELGATGARVVNASREEIVAILKALQPTLDQLVKAGDNLPKALDSLIPVVYPPSVVEAIRNGYLNLRAEAKPGEIGRYDNPVAASLPALAPQAQFDVTPRRGRIGDLLNGGLRG
jgi:phospholipid/cholesterol/gamma-HCH transport system substrate-binding protein